MYLLVGRPFSGGVLHFCVFLHVSTRQCLAINCSRLNFSRVFVQRRASEYRDSVPLRSKGQAFVLAVINDLGSLSLALTS